MTEEEKKALEAEELAKQEAAEKAQAEADEKAKQEAEQASQEAEVKAKEEAELKAKEEADALAQEAKEKTDLSSKTKKSFFRTLFAKTSVEDMPKVIADLSEEVPIHKEPGGGDPAVKKEAPKTTPQELPTGLKSELEKASKEFEVKKVDAEKACTEAENAKAKFDEAEESEKGKLEAEYKACMEKSEKALKDAEAAEEKYNTLKTKEEAEETEKAEEKAKKEKEAEESKNNSPKKFTIEELKAKNIKLAAKPQIRMNANKYNKLTFTELRSKMKSEPNCEESKAAFRALTKDSGSEKQTSDYAMVLESILADPKFNTRNVNPRGQEQPSIIDNIRIHSNLTMDKFDSYKRSCSVRGGAQLQSILERMRSGNSEYMDFSTNTMKKITTLTSGTDYALANPDTLAVEWLALAIFKLFPDNTWKSDIPLFGIASSSANTGLIWTNIASDPTISYGTKPTYTPATAYNVDDDAVALKLTPYWLQPMAFEPLIMAQLRYDKMATNWAQAFMKLDADIDDRLLYTLASTVPSTSYVNTSGPGFPIAAITDVDAFYSAWFTYTGTLARPVLNDIIRLEQIYQKQNFDLGINRPVVVLGTTANSYLAQDSEVKNKLTEWKTIEPGRIAEFRNTSLYTRSRVAAYDQATSTVLDPAGVIPNTAVETNLSFIPNQVGIGMGNLDVFFIQDPSTYSYLMSADLRKGIVPLRKNFNGTGLLNYGTPSI